MKGYLSSLIVILSVCVVACSGGEKQAQPAAPAPSSKTAVAKQEKVKPVLVQKEQEKPAYQISGVRDPFQPFARAIQGEPSEEQGKVLDPLQRLSLSQIELVGVILGKEKRALIQESSGIGYIVSEGTLLGENSGIITKIAQDNITVKQHFKDYMGRVNTREVILSIRKQEGGSGK
ncbi:MAG: pilus assembly protein PilP [Desulfomonilia bacterium]|jgi:type IV pilus assembly protein PilP